MEFIFIILLQFVCYISFVLCDIQERLLYEKLLKNYNVLVRPAEITSNPVNVQLGMILQQLIDIVSFHSIICIL